MVETLEAPAGRSVSLAQGGATDAHAKVLGTHEAPVLLQVESLEAQLLQLLRVAVSLLAHL